MSDDQALIDVRAGDDVSPLAGSWEVDPRCARGRAPSALDISYTDTGSL